MIIKKLRKQAHHLFCNKGLCSNKAMLIEKDQLVSDEPKPAWTTGLTLRGTHKDSNSSMTKICSVSFNHDDKLLCKKSSKKIKPFWRYFM